MFFFSQAMISGALILSVFFAYKLMPIGDATAIMFTSPAVTAFISAFCIGSTRVRLWKILFTALLIISVVLVMQPKILFGSSYLLLGEPYGRLHYMQGALAASLVSIIGSILCVILSDPLKHIDSSLLMFHGGLASLLVAVLMSLCGLPQRILSSEIVKMTLGDWLQLLGNGHVGILGFFLNFKSLQMIDAMTVNALMSLEIIFAFAFQIYPIGQVPNLIGMCGATLTFVCVCAIVLEDRIAAFFAETVSNRLSWIIW